MTFAPPTYAKKFHPCWSPFLSLLSIGMERAKWGHVMPWGPDFHLCYGTDDSNSCYCLASFGSMWFCCYKFGESNPGLPRDRRGYSPLYYLGVISFIQCLISTPMLNTDSWLFGELWVNVALLLHHLARRIDTFHFISTHRNWFPVCLNMRFV